MSTWIERVKAQLGSEGYHPCMRRSFQTIVLYEAKRSMAPRLASMKPFQRKIAFMGQCHYLIGQLSSLMFPNQRQEILWRTMKSRVDIDGECAWERLKNISKELNRLEKDIKPFLAKNRSHNQAVDLMVQKLYEDSKKSRPAKGKDVGEAPRTWEHSHNHVIFLFRLYYKGSELDKSFPHPVVDPNLHVPTKPVHAAARSNTLPLPTRAKNTPPRPAAAPLLVAGPKPAPPLLQEPQVGDLDVAGILHAEDEAVKDRRKLLLEVQQHLDILKHFEGVVPEDDIIKRKRELFLALPPAPASASKKYKFDQV